MTIDRETVALTALWVAWLRKRRTISAKGRQVTDRVFQQWKNKHAASDLSSVIREAEQRAGGIDARDASWPEALQPHLALMLCCEEQRRPGRPRKRLKPAPGSLVHAALMERDAVAADIGGRPRTISADEDRRMLAFLLGAKLALYADAELFRRSDSIQKILHSLRGGWRSIDDAVPDARAFRRVKDSEQFRPYHAMTKDAVRMRLRRARDDFSLNTAEIESGGNY